MLRGSFATELSAVLKFYGRSMTAVDLLDRLSLDRSLTDRRVRWKHTLPVICPSPPAATWACKQGVPTVGWAELQNVNGVVLVMYLKLSFRMQRENISTSTVHVTFRARRHQSTRAADRAAVT